MAKTINRSLSEASPSKGPKTSTSIVTHPKKVAKTINRSPSKASPSKRPETSTSIVTPPKNVKKGKSKIPVKQKIRKTPSSLLKRQSSSSSLSFSSSLLPASSSSSSNSFPADLPATTAQLCSNRTTPPTKKKNDAYLQLSLRVKTDNFEVSSSHPTTHMPTKSLKTWTKLSEALM